MTIRMALLGAALPVLGLVAIAWSPGPLPTTAVGGGDGPSPQIRAGGSEAPCAIPLAWRVTRVDREFGIDIPRATEIVRSATALWQTAASQPLFVHDDAAGFPVRLVYDERQERTQERVRREAEIDALGARLETARAGLATRVAAHEAAARAHSERVRDLELRVAEHNVAVRVWNERGDASPEVIAQLGTVGESLAGERQELEEAGRQLEEEVRALREAEGRLNADVGEHRRLTDALAREFPPTMTAAGEYREAVQRVGGRVVGISREIRIYRFASEAELQLVAAHELGHALGLGHLTGGNGVMAEEHDIELGSGSVDALSGEDSALLRATCPGLGARR